MTWSKTQPTEPGWYWIRLNGTTGACAVEYPDGGADLLVSFAGVEGAYALFDITIAGAEWCGPLEKPGDVEKCEHGVEDGEYCKPCSQEMKRAANEN